MVPNGLTTHRRMDPEVEKRLIADHPEVASDRGKVAFWNFLPPDELNRLLSLYSTVTRKTLLTSETMGIEGRKLLTPEDEYDALKEFNAGDYGQKALPIRDAIYASHVDIGYPVDPAKRRILFAGQVAVGQAAGSFSAGWLSSPVWPLRQGDRQFERRSHPRIFSVFQ